MKVVIPMPKLFKYALLLTTGLFLTACFPKSELLEQMDTLNQTAHPVHYLEKIYPIKTLNKLAKLAQKTDLSDTELHEKQHLILSTEQPETYLFLYEDGVHITKTDIEKLHTFKTDKQTLNDNLRANIDTDWYYTPQVHIVTLDPTEHNIGDMLNIYGHDLLNAYEPPFTAFRIYGIHQLQDTTAFAGTLAERSNGYQLRFEKMLTNEHLSTNDTNRNIFRQMLFKYSPFNPNRPETINTADVPGTYDYIQEHSELNNHFFLDNEPIEYND